MTTSNTIIKIAPALLNAQKQIGAAKKDATNPFFHSSYADLGSVMEACKEALNSNGITVLQPVSSNDGGTYVETVLLHESGEFISDKMRISPKTENNPQDGGSAISYARRYSLQSMVFIPSEDDDGNKASGKPPVKPYNAPRPRVEAETEVIPDVDYGATKQMTTDPYKDWSVGKLKVEISALMNSGRLKKDFVGIQKMTRDEAIALLESVK